MENVKTYDIIIQVRTTEEYHCTVSSDGNIVNGPAIADLSKILRNSGDGDIIDEEYFVDIVQENKEISTTECFIIQGKYMSRKEFNELQDSINRLERLGYKVTK